MIKVLITGANGFLARTLSKALDVERYYQIGLLRSGSVPHNPQIAEFYSSITEIPQHIADGIEVVFHCAAHIPYGNMDESSVELQTTNVDLTAEILKKFSNARIIFCSSVSVYGAQKGSIGIDNKRLAKGAYALSKIQAEDMVFKSSSHAVIRFSSIIGKEQAVDTFVSRAISQAKENAEITLYGSGARVQNYIDVEDAARLLIAVSEMKENILLNGVGLENYSNLEVAEIVKNFVPCTISFKREFSEGASFTFKAQYNEFIKESVGFTRLIETIKKML